MQDKEFGKITLSAIRTRTTELSGRVRQTPMIPLDTPLVAKALGGGSLFLKLECFQETGTFKARGALSNALAIEEPQNIAGITAASAGNHAIAAAWAARACGLPAKVVMQNNANPFRIERAKAAGAEVVLKDPGAATFGEAERLSKEEGYVFVHPFDGVNTVLGTGGVGLEMLAQVPDLDAFVISVGGGGLISGIAAAVKLSNPDCKVYGVEPVGAAGMSKSLKAGRPETLDSLDTIADSLAPPMALPLGYALCAAYVDEIVTVSDDMICAGLVVMQQDAKLAVEPAAGAAMAGLLGPLRKKLQGLRVGLVVCGANIDAAGYRSFLLRGEKHQKDLLDF